MESMAGIAGGNCRHFVQDFHDWQAFQAWQAGIAVRYYSHIK